MKNELIRRAYDSILPDGEAKARMLRNILSALSDAQPERTTNKMRKKSIKRGTMLILAAALALALSVTVLAYATDLFGFRALQKGEPESGTNWSGEPATRISITQPQDVPDDVYEDIGTEIADDIKQKLENSRLAWEEWQECRLGAYDDPVDSPSGNEYDFNYQADSDGQKAKLEEIAAKYGLNLRGNLTLMWSTETTGMEGDGFYTNEELVDIISDVACSGRLFYGTPAGYDKVYYYDEGTFGIGWFADMPACEGKASCYGYNSVYSTLSSGDEIMVYQEDIDSFTSRKHTCPDGTEVTILSNGGDQAFIYVYLEDSFFVVDISGESIQLDNVNVYNGSFTDADLDYIADSINYSVIGK